MRSKAFIIPVILFTALVSSSFTRKLGDPEIDQRLNRIAPCRQGPDTSTIRIIGDVMMHSAQIGRDYTSFLAGIEEDLVSADLAIANMEFALGGEPYSGYPAFSAPDGYAEYAKSAGIDVFLAANNHILDRGRRGLERTIGVYERMGILYSGIGSSDSTFCEHNPLIIRVRGTKVALVNATYGTNADRISGYPEINFMDRTDSVCAQIRRARKAGAELVIALPHWGYEYQLRHNRFQQAQAQQMADSGADIIVGSHPHVVQDMGVVTASDGRRVPVIYSVGNAVSNMSAANTQVELMVTLRLVRHPDRSLEVLDPQWDWLWCSLPGRFCSDYRTIKIEDHLDKREEWILREDYDNMVGSWRRVRNETGIQ